MVVQVMGGEGEGSADLLQLISEASQARQLCRQSVIVWSA